jgi:hypothetical protein
VLQKRNVVISTESVFVLNFEPFGRAKWMTENGFRHLLRLFEFVSAA